MGAPNTAATTSDTIAAARLLLTQMGLSPADLVAPATNVPTFAEIVPAVRATLEAGTRRTYGTHLNRLELHWGDRRLDQVTKPDLEAIPHHPLHRTHQSGLTRRHQRSRTLHLHD